MFGKLPLMPTSPDLYEPFMVESPVINLRHVARGLGLPVPQVKAVVELLDEGNTVPFITRYRKDQTGGLDEEQIRQVQDRLAKMRLLAERKQTILRSIESQGKLTEELAKLIQSASTTKRLEDLYLPYRPKKQTLATLARSRGLEKLAQEILTDDAMAADLDTRAADFINTDRGVATAAEALLGAGHILAEQFSEQAELRQKLREIFKRTGKLVSQEIATETKSAKEDSQAGRTADTPVKAGNDEKVEAKADDGQAEEPSAAQKVETEAGDGQAEKPAAAQKAPPVKKLTKAQQRKKQTQEKKVKAFRDYFNYGEEIRKVPPHRVLAINRGERAKVLRVKVECDMESVCKAAEEMLVPAGHSHAEFLRGCVRDSLTRLIVPGLERELRRELTDRAELHAVNVFAKNLRNLLLQPPIRNRRVLAVDPGFKSGCKLAALDQFGNILEHSVIYLIGRSQRHEAAKQTVIDLVDRFKLTVVAIGNGTACRETEDFFANLIEAELAERGVAYVIVNEAGASVYSTSQLGREEFPSYDATVRGAISIGRRLQDPLSELVKIDPASIGVGMYQHDVKAKHLRVSLDEVVESCVNYVGVDVNTASPALLRYVSGLNQLTARRVYEYRRQNGPFKNRQQLMEVPGFGATTFVQAAGFLKISGGDQPLDSTWIHPESYTVADRVLARVDCRLDDIGGGDRAGVVAERIADVDIAATTEQLAVGELLLKDILAQLARPGRDPREDLPSPIFKKGVLKLEDLSEGMELTGTILNVVDFGAFVDIGMHDSGLVHVSQLADKFIRDPHEAVAVGDIVKVWVVGVDKDRRRVSLTMIKPGSKTEEAPRERKPRRDKSETEGGRGRSESDGKGRTKDRAKGGDAKGPQRRAGIRGEGRRDYKKGGPRGKGRHDARPQFRPKEKPKPFVPITDEMKSGKEAMRTFGDLAQFFNIVTEETKPKENPKKGKKKSRQKPLPKTKGSAKENAESGAAADKEENRPEVQKIDDQNKETFGVEQGPDGQNKETLDVEQGPSDQDKETSGVEQSPGDQGKETPDVEQSPDGEDKRTLPDAE